MILNTLEKSVSNETQRKIDAEAALRVAEENRAKAKENEIAGNLASEISRATGAEKALIINLGNEVSRAQTVEGTLDAKIDAETTRATNAEGALDTKIDGEIARAGAAEDALDSRVTTIEDKIPSQAASDNQLADKAFVNSSINNIAAYYITKNAAGEPFATKAELTAASVFYSGGQVRVPTRNDYTIVLHDESKSGEAIGANPTTRYLYDNGVWSLQYIVNNSGLTAAQLAALNSGATAERLATIESDIDTLETNLTNEVARATGAEVTLTTNLETETANRTNADAAINAKIPTEASSSNQLADKAWVDAKVIGRTVSLPVANWSNKTQTVTVTGVSADETSQFITVRPLIASKSVYEAAEVRAVSAAADSLTFECDTVPTAAISVYVIIQEVTPASASV